MKLANLILPLSLLAVSGFAQDVRYNFDNASDFTKYKTFRWVQIKDAQPMDGMTEQQLKSAINAELMKKGLTEVTGEAGDLLVGYQVSINQEKEFSSYSTDFGYGGGWGRGWYGGGMGSTMTTGQTTTIHVGSVGLDMYDAGQKKLVWRGVASKTLDAKAKPEKRQKNMEKGVEKLLKNYPPKIKS